MTVSPYFSWKVAVFALLGEGSHRRDKHGPVLTAHEQLVMEYYWNGGRAPEDFVEWLISGTTSEKMVG